MLDALAVRMALRELVTADEVDPAIAWYDLRQEQSELRYAEAFALIEFAEDLREYADRFEQMARVDNE